MSVVVGPYYRDVAFEIVPIDGVLADVSGVYRMIAESLLNRPLGALNPTDPPHTLGRLAAGFELSEAEAGRIARCISGINNFWLTLPARGGPVRTWRVRANVIYHAPRIATLGDSVALQTVRWLERKGINNPIVWADEEEAWR